MLMKYLKKYEKLSNSAYTKVGFKLKSIGKNSRGQEMIDYTNEKEYGVYNMWLASRTNVLNKKNHDSGLSSARYYPLKFTNPSNSFNYKYISDHGLDQVVYDDEFVDVGDAEGLVTSWVRGERELSFSLEFYFEAMGDSQVIADLKTKGRAKSMALFTIYFVLAEHNFNHGDIHGEFKSDDANGVDDWANMNFDPNIYMIRSAATSFNNRISSGQMTSNSGGHFYGMFSDRNSAMKFKNGPYKKALDEHHDKIFDIFSAVSADTQQYEEFMKSAKNIRLNFLYDDIYDMEDPSGSSHMNLYKRWYNFKDIKG